MNDDAWCATFAEALQSLCNDAEVDAPVRLGELASVAEEAASDAAMRQLDPAVAAQHHWEAR